MALYAADEDDLIHASDAGMDKIYRCLDCSGPLKRRAGKWHLAHFYHLKATPSCRLYSKSADHLVAQIELQKTFSSGVIELERRFAEIDRIADACWEGEKLVFEIQCSPISVEEIKKRIRDYKSVGYDVVWLLDDKRYNKRICKSEEPFLRTRCSYFLSIKTLRIYDQFEVISGSQRVCSGRALQVDIRRVFYAPQKELKGPLPDQITQLQIKRYFYGDRLDKALHFPLAMQYQRSLEMQFTKKIKWSNRVKNFLKRYIAQNYVRWLERGLKRR